MKLAKADKSKLMKVLCILVVWGTAIVALGNIVGKKPAKPTVVKSAAETKADIQSDKSSPAAKEQKLSALNLQSIVRGISKTEAALGISDWEKPISKARDGIPSLQVYFPQGQSIKAGWQESFVLRSFVNLAIPNPCSAVYEVYADWLKEQVPDIVLTKEADNSGISFVGESKKQDLYIVGKVYSGAVKEAVHIGQYAVKGTDPSAQDKVNQWKAKLSKIK